MIAQTIAQAELTVGGGGTVQGRGGVIGGVAAVQIKLLAANVILSVGNLRAAVGRGIDVQNHVVPAALTGFLNPEGPLAVLQCRWRPAPVPLVVGGQLNGSPASFAQTIAQAELTVGRSGAVQGWRGVVGGVATEEFVAQAADVIAGIFYKRSAVRSGIDDE